MLGLTGGAQNDMSKWYFGNKAALDFMTTPPGIITTSTMTANEGTNSIADAAGNLLFYSDGLIIWDASNNPMANGGPINMFASSCQAGVILKQPGSSSIYYYITTPAGGLGYGVWYATIDMSLAGGSGSVTARTITLAPGSYAEKIAATRHCNGVDYWIVVQELGTNNFKSFLLTSTGINPTPVVSSAGPIPPSHAGTLKLSPNGRKLSCTYCTPTGTCTAAATLFDFDNSTGAVTNAITMPMGAFGTEFSPDGTKVYFVKTGVGLYQYDLCAGSPAAIVASEYSLATTTTFAHHQMQLAIDGKIYLSMWFQPALSVISSPNTAGAGMGYLTSTVPLGSSICLTGLPVFETSRLLTQPPAPQPFTVTIGSPLPCLTASFTAPATSTLAGCSASGYSVIGTMWDFGNPASGAANTSTLTNPTHLYTLPGTYTAQLVVYHTCGYKNDTLRQVINVNNSCLTVSSTSITCSGLGSATAAVQGIGPFSYTWMPSSQTGSVATGLMPGTYTVTVHDAWYNATYTDNVTFTPLVPLTATISVSNSLSCNGAATGTGAVLQLSGGSGSQSYLWSNGISSFTTASVNSLGAGTWSVTVIDGLTNCQASQQFLISQPSAATLSLSSSTPSVCVGGSIVLTGTTSGGTPGYTYTWSAGPAVNTHTVSEPVSGTYAYTLNSSDANGCVTSKTISVGFVNNPTLTIASVSICPLETGTLNVSGATSYTWNGTTTGSSFTNTPLSDTEYTVVGSALTCTASATGSIILKPVPVPTLTSNAPLCNGQSLQLLGSGGASYFWTGPLSFTSIAQNPVLNPAVPNQSGTYNVTVTAANSCTASTSVTVVVNQTPTLSATGSTVCSSQTLNLTGSSVPGATYLWTGPNAFTSSSQNISIASPALNQSGTYSVLVTSAESCTNAITVNALVVAPPSLTVNLSSNGTLCAQALNGSPNTITLTSAGANTYTLSTPLHIGNSNPGGPVTNLSTQPPYDPGVATATIQGSNGVCTVSTTVNFSVIPNPTVTVSSPTPVICAGQTYTYTNSGANSYTWGPGSPGLTTYTSAITVASPTVTTVYSVIGGSLGCNSGTQTSTITVNPLPTVTIVPGTPTVCLGSAISLTATGNGASYTWLPGSIPGSTILVSPLTQQTYTAISSLNSCTMNAMVTVSILPLPTPSITASSLRVCQNESITLQGFGGVLFGWQGPCPLLYNSQTVTFVASSAGYSGVYTLLAFDASGCSNTATINLTIDPLPEGFLDGKLSNCVPFCSDLKFIPSAVNKSPIRASWEINHQEMDGNKFKYCFTTAGSHSIIAHLTDSLNCKNTQTFVVTAWPKPEADFQQEPARPVENNDLVLFTNTSTGEQLKNWHWYIKDLTTEYKTTTEHNSHFFSDAGVYLVVLIATNTWGCEDTIIKTIKIEADFAVYVPNAFTPNDDNRNELFRPVLRGVKHMSFMVYDRWGALLFQTEDPAAGWDGSYRGQPCKQDAYAWRLVASGFNGEVKELKGQVLLLK